MSIVKVDRKRNIKDRHEWGHRRNFTDFDGVEYKVVDETLVTKCSEFGDLMESFKFHDMINSQTIDHMK